LDKGLLKAKSNYERIQDEYDKLLGENSRLKKENLNLEETAQATIALYDITKDICKSLDEDKVFSNFISQINKYMLLRDCKFIKETLDTTQYRDYISLPLEIDKHPIGYLVASGIKEKDKDKFYILAQQFLLGIKRALLYARVQELAITDSLTQVFSRRYYLERFNEEIERSGKFKYSFSFAMADIDHFKDCNDQYGHLVGDAVLREVAKTIKENIRQVDLVGRYGGEEFSIILPETTKEQAQYALERIRQAIENKRIRVYDEELQVTISIGIATFPEDAKESSTLIERADSALYQAKQTGRNRVCLYIP
jgi:diguanylate cyclase (GGDEF)-like protein